jgi:hypothetical protein
MKKAPNEKRLPPSWTFRYGHQVDPQWEKTNCALARLLTLYHHELKSALAIAVEIGRGIDGLAAQMDILCRRTCRLCPEPCCITNTVWFDFRDLLFFHLLNLHIPACQAVSDVNDACPFLSHRGCLLSPRNRPWMCLQYLCPAQLAILKNQSCSAAITMRKKMERIDKQRVEMEREVVYRIKHRKKKPQLKRANHITPKMNEIRPVV